MVLPLCELSERARSAASVRAACGVLLLPVRAASSWCCLCVSSVSVLAVLPLCEQLAELLVLPVRAASSWCCLCVSSVSVLAVLPLCEPAVARAVVRSGEAHEGPGVGGLSHARRTGVGGSGTCLVDTLSLHDEVLLSNASFGA